MSDVNDLVARIDAAFAAVKEKAKSQQQQELKHLQEQQALVEGLRGGSDEDRGVGAAPLASVRKAGRRARYHHPVRLRDPQNGEVRV